MALSDTTAGACEVYYRRLAEMTPSEKVNVGVALWEAGDSLQRASMRLTYPEADDAEINYRIAVTRYGAELAGRAYGRQ